MRPNAGIRALTGCLKLLDDWGTTISPWGLWNRVSCNEKPHTIHAHVIQLALGALMSSLGVQGHSNSREAPERDQQFGETESIVIGKSHRQQKEDIGRINKVLAMRQGLAKIFEKVHNSRHFQRPENDLHIAESPCSNDYTDTCSSKGVHWLSKTQCTNRCTSYYGCENPVEFGPGVT